MTYNEAMKAALATVETPFFHNFAHKQDGDYIVWGEKEIVAVFGDHAVQFIQVDFYTKTEYTGKPVAIINALRDQGFSWVKSAAVEFSGTTGVTHTIITCAWGVNGDETVGALVQRVPAGSNEYGAPIWTETSRDIIAVVVGKKWTEVYAALSAGLKPEITLQVAAADYSEEKVIRLGGVDYQITEAKTADNGTIEITCEDIAKAG